MTAQHELNAQYVKHIFQTADSGKAEEFAAFFADNGSFTFGNGAPVLGVEAILRSNEGFFGSLASMRHQIHHVWVEAPHAIVQATAHYQRRDGKQFTLPVVTVLEFEGLKIKKDQIYMDVNPLLQ